MSIFLEVIVTSVEEAMEAQAGGADRLELVSALDVGGLTPELDTVKVVLNSVSIPVRVMIREQSSMSLGSPEELERLQTAASQIAVLPVNGIVAGYLKDGVVDRETMQAIAAAAPGVPITFHRAFDDAASKDQAIEAVKSLPQVDRVLSFGAVGSWAERLQSISQLEADLAPRIKVIFAVGLEAARLCDSATKTNGARAGKREVHVGRAVRIPPVNHGKVDRQRVAALKT